MRLDDDHGWPKSWALFRSGFVSRAAPGSIKSNVPAREQTLRGTLASELVRSWQAAGQQASPPRPPPGRSGRLDSVIGTVGRGSPWTRRPNFEMDQLLPERPPFGRPHTRCVSVTLLRAGHASSP